MCASIFFLFNVKRFVIPRGKPENLRIYGYVEGDD